MAGVTRVRTRGFIACRFNPMTLVIVSQHRRPGRRDVLSCGNETQSVARDEDLIRFTQRAVFEASIAIDPGTRQAATIDNSVARSGSLKVGMFPRHPPARQDDIDLGRTTNQARQARDLRAAEHAIRAFNGDGQHDQSTILR